VAEAQWFTAWLAAAAFFALTVAALGSTYWPSSGPVFGGLLALVWLASLVQDTRMSWRKSATCVTVRREFSEAQPARPHTETAFRARGFASIALISGFVGVSPVLIQGFP
jgi:hypothetical protein